MAQPEPGTPAQVHPYTADRSRRPEVSLPTWVNVVLILTLLGSCSGVNPSQVDPDSVATEVVEKLRNDRPASPTSDDVTQLCKLLAAVAAKQGLKVDDVLEEDLGSSCDVGARRR